MHWMVKIVAKALLPALLAAPFAAAQTAASHSIEDVLHRMSDQAAVIFVGQVAAIQPHLDQTGPSGYVEVDFRVDQPIRGCSSGSYTLREWAGLWQGSANRYRAGEHLLTFLHAPGHSGLSSPVDGMDGAVPLRPGGAASATTAGGEVVDLRWLGAQVERSGNFTLHTALSPTPLTLAQQMAPAPAAEPLTAATDISRSSVPVQKASVLLTCAWQSSAEHSRRSALQIRCCRSFCSSPTARDIRLPEQPLKFTRPLALGRCRAPIVAAVPFRPTTARTCLQPSRTPTAG